jgi:molybdopterin converting factor small subunit
VATVEFAKAFRRHVECPSEDVEGATLGDVLAAYFERHPAVRGYVLDDQGSFRKHVTLFVDNEQVDHHRGAATAVRPESEVHVFQALSGG